MSSDDKSFSGFSIALRLGIPPNRPNRSLLTDNTYIGKPIIKQAKRIQSALVAFFSQGFRISSTLLVFRRIVFFKELEVFIKTFCSVKDIEIVFGYYKTLELMVP